MRSVKRTLKINFERGWNVWYIIFTSCSFNFITTYNEAANRLENKFQQDVQGDRQFGTQQCEYASTP